MQTGEGYKNNGTIGGSRCWCRKGCRASAFFLAALLCLGLPVMSAPIVISDSRMEHLNGFPSIGRGYSIRSNRLQSMCLKTVEKTKPSFDLKYDIEEVSTSYLKTLTASSRNRIKNSRMNSFIQKYYKKAEQEGETVYKLQNLIVKVEVNTYYYALDETKSPLSDSARSLLEQKEYVTFFNSCGHHYVRSVGTFATYYALLQYRLKGKVTVDEDFKNRLEKGLFNFHGGEKTHKNLKHDAEYRGLRVFVQGIGLSKGNMVNLIPVNISQFRRTIQDAVKLMQDPNSGLITQMEVVPWVENPELTAFMVKRDKDTKKNDGGQQFIRMLRLEANSGVISEINRVSNYQIEQFHVATMCQNMLTRNYIDKSNESLFKNYMGKVKEKTTVLTLTDLLQQKVVSFDPDKTIFYNHIAENEPSTYISLREFIKYFVKKPPQRFFEINRKYLYGSKSDAGALKCINELYRRGLDKADYRTIPSCVHALKPISMDVSFLEQYCLPKPVHLVFKGLKKDKPITKKPVDKKPEDTKKPDIKKDIKTLEDMRQSEKKQPVKKTPVKKKVIKKKAPVNLQDLRPETKKKPVKKKRVKKKPVRKRPLEKNLKKKDEKKKKKPVKTKTDIA